MEVATWLRSQAEAYVLLAIEQTLPFEWMSESKFIVYRLILVQKELKVECLPKFFSNRV